MLINKKTWRRTKEKDANECVGELWWSQEEVELRFLCSHHNDLIGGGGGAVWDTYGDISFKYFPVTGDICEYFPQLQLHRHTQNSSLISPFKKKKKKRLEAD